MYDFAGCECPVCHTPFRDGDDRVVCPDCGTPYHRGCYEQAGRCLYTASHGPDFEWKPPQPPRQETACASCGAMNEVDAAYCKSCGRPMTTIAGDAARYGGPDRKQADDRKYDYEQLYRDAYAANTIDPNEKLEGIPAAEWACYIGPSSRNYLLAFKRMELLNRKTWVSFSAMMWGHYYFLYRKAWKPGIICFLISLLLNLPAYLWLLKLTESTLVAGISMALLNDLVSAASVLLLVFRLFCGLYGFYLYKTEAAQRIRHIQQQFTDPEKRAFVLNAQGGTSKLAVVLAFVAMYLFGELMVSLMGPNLDALFALLGM